jgi:hypothetical protein
MWSDVWKRGVPEKVLKKCGMKKKSVKSKLGSTKRVVVKECGIQLRNTKRGWFKGCGIQLRSAQRGGVKECETK